MSEQAPMLQYILSVLDDNQASEVACIDVKKQTPITDYMIIASARSSRHARALAQNLIEKMKEKGHPPLSETGLETGEWVLIDFADYIVHVMQAEIRAFYNLEGLWQGS